MALLLVHAEEELGGPPSELVKLDRLTFYLRQDEEGGYYGRLMLGTEKVSMLFVFSTGSSALWFPTQRCANCTGSKLYDTQSSNNFVQTSNSAVYIKEEDWSVWGYPCRDDVWVSNSNRLASTPCVAVYKQQNLVLTGGASGYLGLAPNTTTKGSFVDRLVDAGVLSERKIQLELDRNRSESRMIFGAPNYRSISKALLES